MDGIFASTGPSLITVGWRIASIYCAKIDNNHSTNKVDDLGLSRIVLTRFRKHFKSSDVKSSHLSRPKTTGVLISYQLANVCWRLDTSIASPKPRVSASQGSKWASLFFLPVSMKTLQPCNMAKRRGLTRARVTRPCQTRRNAPRNGRSWARNPHLYLARRSRMSHSGCGAYPRPLRTFGL